MVTFMKTVFLLFSLTLFTMIGYGYLTNAYLPTMVSTADLGTMRASLYESRLLNLRQEEINKMQAQHSEKMKKFNDIDLSMWASFRKKYKLENGDKIQIEDDGSGIPIGTIIRIVKTNVPSRTDGGI